jgi:hypothetical protein
MCTLRGDAQSLARRLQEQLNFVPAHVKRLADLTPEEWYKYALLILVTDTPRERAVTYLEDTGSPEAATGRLLLRAAERALREDGDTPASDREKQEGDEG